MQLCTAVPRKKKLVANGTSLRQSDPSQLFLWPKTSWGKRQEEPVLEEYDDLNALEFLTEVASGSIRTRKQTTANKG